MTAEREHAGDEEVDRIAQVRVDGVDLREEHEDPDGDQERDEETLAATERQQDLDARLRVHAARVVVTAVPRA